MIIGIDFDNTIVDYSGVFFDTAIGLGWLKNGQSGSSKEEVKHYFVSKGLESKWTELQGIVYGKTIAEAKPYSGVVSCLKHWAESGHELKIISHKTKYPIVGDKLDFHSAALNWLECHIFSENDVLTSLRNKVFFNSTIDLKIEKIKEVKCDVFIDDLPKIFEHIVFPESVCKVLFSPHKPVVPYSNIIVCSNWKEIRKLENFLVKS